MVTLSEVLSVVEKLSRQKRAEVARALLLSLEPDDGDADADAAWAIEIRRRLQAIRQGTVALRDWDEVLAEIRQSIRCDGS